MVFSKCHRYIFDNPLLMANSKLTTFCDQDIINYRLQKNQTSICVLDESFNRQHQVADETINDLYIRHFANKKTTKMFYDYIKDYKFKDDNSNVILQKALRKHLIGK